jgi:DNA-binding transcriptional ArsR family regulator
MVSDMVQSAAADDVFHALSNPTRRRVLERLSVGPATVSELAAPFDMQLPSFVSSSNGSSTLPRGSSGTR